MRIFAFCVLLTARSDLRRPRTSAERRAAACFQPQQKFRVRRRIANVAKCEHEKALTTGDDRERIVNDQIGTSQRVREIKRKKSPAMNAKFLNENCAGLFANEVEEKENGTPRDVVGTACYE